MRGSALKQTLSQHEHTGTAVNYLVPKAVLLDELRNCIIRCPGLYPYSPQAEFLYLTQRGQRYLVPKQGQTPHRVSAGLHLNEWEIASKLTVGGVMILSEVVVGEGKFSRAPMVLIPSTSSNFLTSTV